MSKLLTSKQRLAKQEVLDLLLQMRDATDASFLVSRRTMSTVSITSSDATCQQNMKRIHLSIE